MKSKFTAPVIVTGIVLASCLGANPAFANTDSTIAPIDETNQSAPIEAPEAPEESAPAPESNPAPAQPEQQAPVVEEQKSAPVAAPAPVADKPAVQAQTVVVDQPAPVVAPVDAEKPVVNLVSAPVVFNNGTQLVINATDDLGLAKIVANVYKNGALVKSTQSPASGVSGSHTVNFASLGLADGSYTLRYNALDAAGKVAVTKEFSFQLDNTAPTITDKGGVNVVNGRQQVGSYKLYDAGKIDYVTVNGVKKDLSNNAWSDLNGLKPGVFGAVEGTNTIIAYDVAGNQSAPLVVVLDTTGPVLTLKPEGTIGADGVYKKVSYKLNDGANVVKAILNGVEKNLTPNQWSDLNGVTVNVFGGVEGVNTLVLVDGLGNESTHTFTIDTTKPLINTPQAGEWVSGTHTWSLTQEEANPAKAYVEIQQLVDGKWKKFDGEWFYGTNVFDAAFDTTGLASGVQSQIKISSWDKAGNQSGASFAVQIDNTAPTITLKPESIGSEDVYSNVSFKLFDSLSGVKSVTVNDTVKPLSVNKWSDLNGLKPGKFGAVEGENTVVVTDVAGNTATFIVNLDGTAPDLVTEQYSWDAERNRESITVTFSEPVTGMGQGWYGSDGMTYTKVVYNKKPITLNVSDKAGNTSEFTLQPQGAPVVVTPPEAPASVDTPAKDTDNAAPAVQPVGTNKPKDNAAPAAAANQPPLPATGSNGEVLGKLTAGGLLLSFLGALLMKLRAVFGG